jgi:hypothetical protein
MKIIKKSNKMDRTTSIFLITKKKKKIKTQSSAKYHNQLNNKLYKQIKCYQIISTKYINKYKIKIKSKVNIR